MKAILVVITQFLIFAVIYCGVSAGTDSSDRTLISNSKMTSSFHNASRYDLVAFVNDARDYARLMGREKACLEFDNKTGNFVRGDLYIYAYDFLGINVAHPFRPDFIGKSKINLTDPNGVAFIKDLADNARRGEGFTYFIFPNPDHGGQDELKIGYAALVDDFWWLGSGIYLSDVPAFFSQESRQELASFVDEAFNYINEHGKDTALRAFNDRNGSFVRGNFYVYAYDFNGTVLALPYQPELIGKNRIDTQDSNGVWIIQNLINQAKRGQGYAYYLYPDPGKNMTYVLKLSYVKKVDDSWWLGAGIYGAELNSENATAGTYLGEVTQNTTDN